MFLFSLYLGLRLSLQNKPWRTTTSFFVDVVYTIHGCPQKSHWPGTWNTLVLYWYVKNMLFQIFCFFKKCTYIGRYNLNLAKTRTRKPIIIIIMELCVISELEGKASNYSSKPKNGIFYATFPQAANWWRAPPPPPPSSWRRLGTTISTTVRTYYAAAYPNDICSPCKALTSSCSGSAL